MTRRHRIALVLAWVALAGFAGYQAHVVHEHADEASALARRAERLAAEAVRLRHERDATVRDLELAAQQMAELPPTRATDPAVSTSRQAEIDGWLARVRKLHGAFEANPAQRIPEMLYLTDEDWLRVSKSAAPDSDDGLRRALAEIRSTATAKFVAQLSKAMRRYAFDHQGAKPASLSHLVTFFDARVVTAILERYELTDEISKSFRGVKTGAWAVQNKAPIDLGYDSRYQVYIDGQISGQASDAGPAAWIPELEERLKRAYRAYANAHQGDYPKGIAAVVPYFDPPLDPALTERLVRSMTK